MVEPVEPILRGARPALARAGRPRRAREAAAALVAAAGAIHLYLWFDFFHRVHLVGPLFLVNAGAGGLIAVGLVASANFFVLLAGAGYSAGTFVAFLISTRWGLFGYHERFWGRWQVGAGAVELVAALLLLAALVRAARARRCR
jgi:hypothetical protein